MLYKDWCEEGYYEASDYGIISTPIRPGKSLKKAELDILRFLAENGPVSTYDLAKGIPLPIKKRPGKRAGKSPSRRGKGLGYSYTLIHRYVNSLKHGRIKAPRLIEIEQNSKGGLKRFNIRPTFDGMLVYLKAWKLLDDEAKKSMEEAIKRYPDHFLFSKYWKEIVETVGADTALSNLIKTTEEIGGRLVEFSLQHPKLEFEAFVNTSVINGRKKTRAEKNERFSGFLREFNELKDIYVSYLVLEDIVLFTKGRIEEDEWKSEEATALLEKAKPHSKLSLERLKLLLPRFTEINYVFTGMLMDRLLWKKLEQKETRTLERKGFAISL